VNRSGRVLAGIAFAIAAVAWLMVREGRTRVLPAAS
jgi:hypothetical protein